MNCIELDWLRWACPILCCWIRSTRTLFWPICWQGSNATRSMWVTLFSVSIPFYYILFRKLRSTDTSEQALMPVGQSPPPGLVQIRKWIILAGCTTSLARKAAAATALAFGILASFPLLSLILRSFSNVLQTCRNQVTLQFFTVLVLTGLIINLTIN